MPISTFASGRLDALWLICLAIYILAGAAIVPFHGDESTLMVMGRDYHYLFVEGDLPRIFYDEHWRVSPHEQHLRLLNGTVSKTIYGWAQAQLGTAPRDLNPNWDWGRDYAENAARGAIPDGELLRVARVASALQLALAAAALFQFVKIITNRPTAFLASALFALHPNMLINGRRAMMEGSHILGLLLVLLAAAWLMQERRWWRYGLLGLCGGFAIAAKHPNVSAYALVLLACAVDPLWKLLSQRGENWPASARDLGGVALAGGMTVVVFLLLNPAWWRAPLDVAAVVVEERQELLGNQVDWLGGYSGFVDQLNGFFRFVFVGERQYFEVARWTQYDAITAQIEAYEQSWLAGLLLIGSSGRLGVICLLLAAYGAFRLSRAERITLEHRRLLLFWIFGAALTTLWLTPLPWARYYLPLLPALVLLLAYALTTLAQALVRNATTKTDGLALLD